ncbi:hypothetical protein PR202_ga31358 [Eleusine coracana subsp. coracana]|uniref:Light-mediated development protein DET1 n=1 Tax=Eleusine coracana subsp. coracana TaxID=191504 RepID=A0AAV5DRH6_ELECO|nr:hypothetical protein PR202_ga31358 [Eleusine coracana subsp. coracana]
MVDGGGSINDDLRAQGLQGDDVDDQVAAAEALFGNAAGAVPAGTGTGSASSPVNIDASPSGSTAAGGCQRRRRSRAPTSECCKCLSTGLAKAVYDRNHQDLIVYRPIWLTYSCNEECDSHDLPPKSKKFESFFKELYSVPLASSNEYICKDFFLYMECHQFGLFATSTAQSNDSSATEGAINGVPSIEKITFYLVRLEDGVILDEKAFCNDFINLAHSIGAYLYEDLLCIVSLRYQTIHILQIRDSGNLVERVQHLKKKFYFHFQDYVDLIIWKVSRSTDQNLAFFAVYNMETTDIVSLYQNSSEELYSLFEHFYDHFHANPQNSSHGKFISSHSNDAHALDQLRIIKNKASSSSQFVKKMMASLPYTCQSQSPSPYFDLSIFRYDEKLISAIDRHRHCTEHPIKFISARPSNVSPREKRQPVVKFKIKPGPDSGTSDSRAKRISSFLFHPFFPLALSIQQTYMQPTVVNIHFRR